MSVQTTSLSPTRQRGRYSIPSLARRTQVLAVLAVFVVCASAPAQQKIRAAQPVWTDEHFDQWVFQQDSNATAARRRLTAQMALQIEDIDRACQLTEAQQKKLHLAGQGDLKRFFDRYEKVKQKFQSMKHDQEKFQEIWQDITPLQMALQAGLFYDDSLLYKSLPNTLTGDQLTRYDAIVGERRAFRHRATIELAVTLLEQALPLRDAQRQELITLLTKETKPPRKSGQYDYYRILTQLGRVAEAKLKPLFDNTQWKILNRQLDQFKGMELALKQSGQLANDADEPDRAVAIPAPLKK